MIKHGNRITKNGPVQVYLCRSCGRIFSKNSIPYMNTRSILILKGLSLYNQGYSLGRSVKILEESTGERVPRNTLHYWTRNYKDIFTYLEIRKKKEKLRPLLPKVYDGVTFSIHKNKVSNLPKELKPISDLLLRTSKGIDQEKLKGVDLSGSQYENWDQLTKRMEVTRSPSESRILNIALENNEKDPLRYVLINDSSTLARNLPLWISNENTSIRFLDLLQFKDGTIRLISFVDGPLNSIEDLKHLIRCGRSLVDLTGLPVNKFIIGAFNREEMWTMDLPIQPKKIRVKNN